MTPTNRPGASASAVAAPPARSTVFGVGFNTHGPEGPISGGQHEVTSDPPRRGPLARVCHPVAVDDGVIGSSITLHHAQVQSCGTGSDTTAPRRVTAGESHDQQRDAVDRIDGTAARERERRLDGHAGVRKGRRTRRSGGDNDGDGESSAGAAARSMPSVTMWL